MEKKERRRRAVAAGLNPDTATEKEILEAETKGPKKTVTANDKEEDTKKIFNLATPPNDKTPLNKQVITDPVKAWGKPR